ncbi:MAG TPA: hypothetical protein VGH19_04520 [Verrucomicrobiae bacterium]
MSIAIHCILEVDIAVSARMEGKSLAIAYCSDSMGNDSPPSGDSKIIAVDFGGAKSTPPPSESPDAKTLLSPLTPFISELGSEQWHDATVGLAAVQSILAKIRKGAKVPLEPDLGFGRKEETENDLTEGMRYDLEQLEKILLAAQEASLGFHLAFGV